MSKSRREFLLSSAALLGAGAAESQNALVRPLSSPSVPDTATGVGPDVTATTFDFVQADRFRRAVAQEMDKLFSKVDLLLVPSLRDEMLTIGNFTGYPSLTLRAGFIHVAKARSDWDPDPRHPLPHFDPPRRVPQSVTLLGRLFDEGTIGRVGLALERELGVANQRPRGFA